MIITTYSQQFNPYQNDILGSYQYGMPSTPYMPQYQQQQNAVSNTNVDWIYVNGVDGAKNQIVQPGHIRWMMDNNQPIIYVKAVDTMGSVTLKCFNIFEFDPNATVSKEKTVEYATKEEVDKIKEILSRLQNELGGMPDA